MITPINRDAPVRRVIAYDMEWFPGTLELRLIGVHDGREYRTYTEVDAFLNGELIPETAGAWYYAHAGGLADFQFLLERLIERGYQVKIAFSGSSAIIVEVQRGELRWTLVDSYWLLRSPLAKIGEAIGIKKMRDYLCPGTSLDARGWVDGRGCSHPPADDPEKPVCIFYAPMGELRAYNEQDCLILQTAITRFQEEMISMNGELCMTQASSAMKLYRRAYLDRPIRTNAVINSRARESYVGSRVEPFATRCNARGGIPWAYYDINSSFPYAMTFPAPGNMRGGRSRLTDSVSEMFLADVEIEVPEMYLPPVPWRSPRDGRIYFPTGSWRAWLWGIDVRLLESVGGRILKVHRVIDFDEHTTLAAYALDLYDKRLKSTTEFEKMLYKLLLNSLYGKFGESPIKSAAYLNPEDTTGMEMLMPGIYLREEPMEIPHEHVPIATHITSFARRTLYRFDSLCLSIPGGRIAYNDTDSCVTTIRPEQLPAGVIGKKLGQMKHEYDVRDGQFVAAKFYTMDVFDVEKQKDKRIIRAKGFSGITYEDFVGLVEGRPMSIRRMTRVRELIRSGNLTPREEIIEKRLKFGTRPKRSPEASLEGEGTTTRPWSVSELLDTTWAGGGIVAA